MDFPSKVFKPGNPNESKLGARKYTGNETISDGSQLEIVDSKSGFGFVMGGDNTHYAIVNFASTGAPVLDSITGTVNNTDTGSGIAIFRDGTTLVLKNRTGGNLNLKYVIFA